MDKSVLTPEQQIEYYLGKDRLPNLHWKPCIPPMWAIPARANTHIHKQKETIAYKTLTDPITKTEYKFNNLGYRSNIDYNDDLKNSRVILMLGCSDTWGRFVDYDKIYSSLIQKQLPNSIVVNMAVPGGSPDQATRIGVQTISYLKSAITDVCMFWPGFSLREFVSKNFSSGTYTSDKESVPYKDWWDHIDWINNNYNYQKNKLLLESTCQAHNINYYDLIVNREDTIVPFDYMYNDNETVFGEKAHQAMAAYFYKKITKQPSLYQQLTQS
jgi:hypothetical protein